MEIVFNNIKSEIDYQLEYNKLIANQNIIN